jgi:diacylglycerol kinase (ATP)
MAQARIGFILHGQRCPTHLPNRLLERFTPDFLVDIHITSSALGALEVATLAVEQGCDYLIAVGGDGTINEMVNGVMRAPSAQRKRVILGVLPCGTGNDFARSLASNTTLVELQRLVLQGDSRELDLGRLDYRDAQGGEQLRYFANIASLGISSSVVERVQQQPRWLPAAAAYALATIQTLLVLRPSRLRLQLDQRPVQSESLIQLSLANGRFFGGGLGIAPSARLDDGWLDVVMIRGASAWAFLRFLPALRQARLIQDARISYDRCHRIEISAQSGNCLLEADGEQISATAVVIDLIPAALRWLPGVEAVSRAQKSQG